MRGKVYGVGVGPGDPSLMTLKAAEVLRRVPVVAFPGRGREDSLAYRIAVQAVPELAGKEALPLFFPMVREGEERERALKEAAEQVKAVLLEGRDVAVMTLGDVAVYSTFRAVAPFLEKEGFETEMVSAVPSFCAAAALLNLPLVQGEEPLHVLPAFGEGTEEVMDSLSGTLVLMKPGKDLRGAFMRLEKSGRQVWAVRRAGLAGEEIYESAADLPEEGDYFTVLVAREREPEKRY